MYLALLLWIFTTVTHSVHTKIIEIINCEPPDVPEFGGYGPVKDFYTVGDEVHYYCDTFTRLEGNSSRVCKANGEWTENIPFCDSIAKLKNVQQTSIAEPFHENEALNAADNEISTCSSTKVGSKQVWRAEFEKKSIVHVSTIVPPGIISYRLNLVQDNGETVNCGEMRTTIDTRIWINHRCNAGNVVSLVITSTSDEHPLELCEVMPFTVPDIFCLDPKIHVKNGRMIISRNKASLVCNSGFTKSPDSVIHCIARNASEPNKIALGIWEQKSLYCTSIEKDVKVDISGVHQKDKHKPCL